MYGQYSENSPGKLTKADMLPYSGVVESKKVGHNRVIYTHANGERRFRLIHADILTFDPVEGVYTVDTGGYSTMTTRRAIGEAIEAFAPDISAYVSPGARGKFKNAINVGMLGESVEGTYDGGKPYVRRYRVSDLGSFGFNRTATFRLDADRGLEVLMVDGQRI